MLVSSGAWKNIVQDLATGRWGYLHKQKPEPGVCEVRHCTRRLTECARERGTPVCGTCRTRLWRLNNPVHAHWKRLKDRATRRKQEFTLTLEEFREFCQNTGYLDKVGNFKGAFHCDRKDPLRGYSKDNIRVLDGTENLSKGSTYDKAAHRRHREEQAGQQELDDENPF